MVHLINSESRYQLPLICRRLIFLSENLIVHPECALHFHIARQSKSSFESCLSISMFLLLVEQLSLLLADQLAEKIAADFYQAVDDEGHQFLPKRLYTFPSLKKL